MRIERIDLLVLRNSLIRPFSTSSSRRDYLEHIIVKAYADGLVGWGECASPIDPYYCEETTETCWHILEKFIAPNVLGKEWLTPEEVVALYGKVKRNNFAKAGLEMACWDLLAKSEGKPLHELLGGTRSEILSGVSLGIEEDLGRLMANVDQYVGEGYRRVKLKIAPGKDVSVVSAVREKYPDLPLMADANSAYTLDDVAALKELDHFNLMMIEQPLASDDIVDHAELQSQLQTPICLDESIHSVEDVRRALSLDSGRIINIKVSRLGGLFESKKVHDYCHARNVPVWCGGMHEYGVGRAANLAISSLPGFSLPGDVSGSDKYYARDIVDPVILADQGSIALRDAPGIGYTPDERAVADFTTRSVTLTT